MSFDATIDERGIAWTGYPFRPASVFPNGSVAWASVRDVDPAAFPPEVRLRGGETLFVPQERSEELARQARAANVAIVSRVDVWSDLLDPFLDTVHGPEWVAKANERLRACGISDEERERIRSTFGPAILAYNASLWDWTHLGLFDFLSAVLSDGRLAPSEEERHALHAWAMGIAERGRR